MKCIDLFAGAGGFSEAAKMAGHEVIWAGNHWPAAVAVHQDNHPEAIHLCQDLHQADWTTLPAYDVLLASPCCQGHSRARGKDRPHHDAARSTAWAVVSAAECARPAAFVVENVPEFAYNWALYPAWVLAMEALGYTLRAEVLDAQFFGVPQQRKRLFIVGTRGRAFDFGGLGGLDPMPISSALDLNSGSWSSWHPEERQKPLVANTMERIQAGLKRHGKAPFWIPYFGANRNGWALDRPIWTLTTRDRYALVDGDRFRFLTADECRAAMGFPPGYCLTGKSYVDKMLLGNAVCPPVAAQILSRLAA